MIILNMSDIYSTSLMLLRDARKKRGKIELTKKFFDTLKCVNQVIPMNRFHEVIQTQQQHETRDDDAYSNKLLMEHSPLDAVPGHCAKVVSSNGNCLFNSASVALIGNSKIIITHFFSYYSLYSYCCYLLLSARFLWILVENINFLTNVVMMS